MHSSHPSAPLWAAYVATFGKGLTQEQIGSRAGVNQATVGRWLGGKKAPTEAATVAALAVAFDRNPLEAFVAAGFLSEEEAGRGLEDDSREVLEFLRTFVRPVDDLRDRAFSIAFAEVGRRDRRREVLPPDALSRVVDDLLRRAAEEDEEVLAALAEVPVDVHATPFLWPVRSMRARQIAINLYGDVPFDLPESTNAVLLREANARLREAEQSDLWGTVPDAIAALDDESITGEQEGRHDT